MERVDNNNFHPEYTDAGASIQVIELAGFIDRSEVARLANRLESAVRIPDVVIVLDLTRATAITSIGAQVILNLVRQIGPANVVLICEPGRVRTTLNWLGFMSLVRHFDNREDCLNVLQGVPPGAGPPELPHP